jgi:UDP-N-acetylglucosamine--N-acetylmuramyl-(pentapeptide) pyrophosphoryl-undecaprenol N-acetylglucosamine transferase
MNEAGNIYESSVPPLGGGGGIIIAGGGTGGHIFPAIAIANALKKMQPQVNILFVGAKGKMEMEKVPQAGYKIEGLDIAGFNRSSLIKNIGLPFKLVKSFFQVRTIFKKFKPVAVIGVGGYSSFPVLRFAQSQGIKTFIHESNSFAGKSNMMLGKNATKIFVAIDGMEQFFPAEKIIISGNPVRASITNNQVNREEAINFFGLDANKKTVLSIGGSLGAKSINEALDKDIEQFEKNNLQLIWQTGKPYAAKGKERGAGRKNIWVNDFITQMECAYAAADVVISRSGAMSVGELCVMKKPALFVPYPYAAEDHQTVNAKKLADKNAAMMIKDSEAAEKLVPTIIALAKDEVKQNELKINIAPLAITNADEVVAGEILKEIAPPILPGGEG